MKNIKTIITLVVLCIITILTTNAKEIESTYLYLNKATTPAEQVYNRLVISTRIVKFTNRYVDSKQEESPEVPSSVWTEIKNSIDYDIFKKDAIQVLNNNLTISQMKEFINEFEENPFIPIPSLKIKQELYELMPKFYKNVDNTISQVLQNNGFNLRK